MQMAVENVESFKLQARPETDIERPGKPSFGSVPVPRLRGDLALQAEKVRVFEAAQRCREQEAAGWAQATIAAAASYKSRHSPSKTPQSWREGGGTER